MAVRVKGRLEHADLTELVSYALVKMPHRLRKALAAPDHDRQRAAEAQIAERVAHEMRHLAVSGPPGSYVSRSCARTKAMALPITEADLPYQT